MMSLRSPRYAFLLAALAGCALDASDEEADTSSDTAEIRARLEVQGAESIEVLPSSSVVLAVRLVDLDDQPIAGVPVEFAFADTAPGASLPQSPPQSPPTTDTDGVAKTLLQVGSKPSVFRVRASAQGAEPVFIEVEVTDALASRLRVQVSYAGQREIVSRTVTTLPSVTCEDALATEGPVTGESTVTLSAADDEAEVSLGPGLTYAVLAWGHDALGSVLARGCAERSAPITGEARDATSTLDVELLDIPLRLEANYDVAIRLEIGAYVERVRATFTEALLAALPSTDTRDADVLLDALEARLAARDKDVALAELQAARLDGTLAANLQAQLTTAMLGPSRFAADGALNLLDIADTLTLEGTYGAASSEGVPMTFVVDAGTVRAIDGRETAQLEVLPLATIDATYNDTLAVVDVATLGVQLGLGTFGKTVVSAGLPGLEQAWDRRSGCELLIDEVESIVAPGCDATCIARACTDAFDTLVETARSSLPAALDADHPNIGLRGLVPVHDRTGNGVIDDLGPAALMGSWGKPLDEDAPNELEAQVLEPRVEPETADEP